MNDTMNLADRIAHMEADLNFLQTKSEQDDQLISVLKQQNEMQAMEISKMAADHAEELRKLRQRCDLAVRNEREISGILETAASGILQGLRKMKGDQTPPAPTPRQAARPGPSTESLPGNELPRGPVKHPTLAPPEVSQFAPRSRPIESVAPADVVDDGLAEMVNRFPQQATRR